MLSGIHLEQYVCTRIPIIWDMYTSIRMIIVLLDPIKITTNIRNPIMAKPESRDSILIIL